MVFLYSFRFCSVFVCEGYISSIPVFTFSFAFSGFHKCHSFVLLRKNMSSQITASSFFVILSLSWISFNSVTLCSMLSVWCEDHFWFMNDSMTFFGILNQWTGSNIPYLNFSFFLVFMTVWLEYTLKQLPQNGD